jgi:DME family drug/metabolite transporter
MLDQETKGAFLVMGAGCLWGTFGILAKLTYGQTTMGPLSLALLRLIFALPFLGLFVAIKRYPIQLTKRDVGMFAAFGLCSITIFQSLYFTAFVYTDVQHAVALLYTAPAFVAILSKIFLKERLTRTKVAAVGLSILGTFLILGIVTGASLFGSSAQIGDWLAVLSGLAYSSWYIFGKALGKTREPAVTCFLVLCFGAIILLPFTAVLEPIQMQQSLSTWMLIAIIGIFPTAIAYILYLSGLKFIDATKASVFAIVEPLTGVVLAYFFFQETFSTASFLGFGLIISSIILISSSRT